MKQRFCLFIVVVFLFGAAVVHSGNGNYGQDTGTVQNIDCSNAGSISFSIDIPDIAQWEGSAAESAWALNGEAGCEPTFDQSNGLVKYSGIDVATCDPGVPSSTSDKFVFKFEISVSAVAGDAISPATFAYDQNYIVKCFYNREKENIMASFQPSHSLSDSGSDDEDFTIDFTVHLVTDDSEVTSTIDLSTAVYGKLEITGSVGVTQDLDLHLRKVTADNDQTSGGDEFELISDGCAVSSIVTSTTCDTDEEDRFYFDIFRFPEGTNDVYLTAKIIVCLTDNSASVCQSECTACSAPRKRRDTLKEIQQTEFYVTAGPFKVLDPHQGSDSPLDEEGTALPAYMIAVVAISGLLAVAILSAIVLIAFRRRRQRVTTVELQHNNSVAV